MFLKYFPRPLREILIPSCLCNFTVFEVVWISLWYSMSYINWKYSRNICTQSPASLAQLVAWLFHWLDGTGFESRLGWPFIFMSPHPRVCSVRNKGFPVVRANQIFSRTTTISHAVFRWTTSSQMNSMKLVILLQSLYWSIHSKDESKRSTACAFIFGVNWLWRCDVTGSFGVFFHEIKCKGMKSFVEFIINLHYVQFRPGPFSMTLILST